jgi:adenylate kinase family enzyme
MRTRRELFPGQRIAIVGTSGSGKTTLARTLAARLGMPHVELDALHWGPGWTPSSEEEMRPRVVAALDGETWVVDGNYSKVRNLIWPRADTLIWLDYALPLVLARLTRRTLWRIVRRERLWNENREELRHLIARDSIFVWALQSHPRHRRQYPELLARVEHAHLTIIRLRSPGETTRWLRRIPPAGASGLRRSGQPATHGAHTAEDDSI